MNMAQSPTGNSSTPPRGTSEASVLGIVELDSVAQGYQVLDAMVKAAPVRVLATRVINPGKFVIEITGEVASAEMAMKAALTTGKECLLDFLLITNLHPDVLPALSGSAQISGWDALGVIESYSVTGSVEAADLAAKEADVRIMEIRIGDEMGGKSTAILGGALGEVEAALAVAEELLREKELLVRTVTIPRPHDDLKPFVPGGMREG